ncbi:hypothetical protein AGMMS50255_3570 [Spirochaetia bacterium]|nr:hypothetical protein AGMMS50255_3570 [Spirochaetia bacterium]
MTENAKIAKLWLGFHHLSEDDKELVVKIAEVVRPPEKFCLHRAAKELEDGDSCKEVKL